ncbi:MAG: hypothetical protein AAGF35_03200 [Pseudomonadota bacterium]
MTREEAYSLIQQALDAMDPELAKKVTYSTDLIGEKIIDSLDSMNFLYELETLHGSKIDAIDDDYEDFRIESLIQHLIAS